MVAKTSPIKIFTSDDAKRIEHLEFSSDFQISIGEKSKIILGANGIGKTSIYKEISKNKNYHFIDYGEIEQSFKNNKKKLFIAAHIKTLDDKLSERGELEKKIDILTRAKKVFSVGTQKELKEIDPVLGEITNKVDGIAKTEGMFVEGKFSEIEKFSDDERSFIYKNLKIIIESKETKSDIDKIKDRFLRNSFESLEKYLDDKEKTCPICDTPKEKTIKELINQKREKLLEIDDTLILEAVERHNDKSSGWIRDFVDGIKGKFLEHNISSYDVISFALDKFGDEPLLPQIASLKKLTEEIGNLNKEKEEFYSRLSAEKENIINEFVLNFQVEKPDLVKFDDTKHEIEVTLPREVNEYSTGEIRLMLFVVYIYEGIASDKEFIVIDDPLSSYDIINQYKIIYKIAFANKIGKQKLLIFTHNIDTLNIVNTQHPNICEYQYIEKYGKKLHIQDIQPFGADTFLKVKNILQNKECENSSYIKLLIEREEKNDDSDLHKVFHYKEPFEFMYGEKEDKLGLRGKKFSNDYLVGLIDNFEDSLENVNFENNIINKITYLAATRVWVEKQFKTYHYNDAALDKLKTLGEKINYLFSDKHQKIIWKGSKKVTRGFLMSKKVMLNQNMHIESQRVPFEYALNLSIDDLSEEIRKIKEAFVVEEDKK